MITETIIIAIINAVMLSSIPTSNRAFSFTSRSSRITTKEIVK